MYADREYERVLFDGLMDEVAMKPSQFSPPYASLGTATLLSASVVVRLPTRGTMLWAKISGDRTVRKINAHYPGYEE